MSKVCTWLEQRLGTAATREVCGALCILDPYRQDFPAITLPLLYVKVAENAAGNVCHVLFCCALAAKQQGFAVDGTDFLQDAYISAYTGTAVFTGAHFWSNVRDDVLPELQRAKAALDWTKAPLPEDSLLDRALAVATFFPCANRGCINVHGSSEAQVKSRKCSRCGVARYCSETCQKQHWSEHKVWCKKLKAATAADAAV
jgi:MYND finger